LAGQEPWEEFSVRGDIEVKIEQEIASTSVRPLSPETVKEVYAHFGSQCRVRQKANHVAHLVETTSIKSALESQGITEKEKEALGLIFNFVFPKEAVSV
jgi:ribosomal protein L20A (L18A)